MEICNISKHMDELMMTEIKAAVNRVGCPAGD